MNKFTTNIVLPLVIVTSLSVFQGCSRNPLGTVKVSGTVTLDGAPIEGVTVTFYPVNGNRECYGFTDAQGQFVVTIPGTAIGSGAIPGEYIVAFTKEIDPMDEFRKNWIPPADEQLAAQEFRKQIQRLPPVISLLPKKYADKTTTDCLQSKWQKVERTNLLLTFRPSKNFVGVFYGAQCNDGSTLNSSVTAIRSVLAFVHCCFFVKFPKKFPPLL